MAVYKLLQFNGELDVPSSNKVLDLNSENLTLKPCFWMMQVYLYNANLKLPLDFVPITTIFPSKHKDSSLGIMDSDDDCHKTLLKWMNLETFCVKMQQTLTFLGCNAMAFSLSWQSKFTVATMF